MADHPYVIEFKKAVEALLKDPSVVDRDGNIHLDVKISSVPDLDFFCPVPASLVIGALMQRIRYWESDGNEGR